jgi:hypothetical protein
MRRGFGQRFAGSGMMSPAIPTSSRNAPGDFLGTRNEINKWMAAG